MLKIARVLGASLIAVAAGGCAKMTLAWADLSGSGAPASPPVLDLQPSASAAAAWRNERAPEVRAAFEAAVYGTMPDSSATEIISKRTIDAAAYGGAGIVDEYQLVAKATFNGVERSSRPFYIDVVLPANTAGPAPVIMIEAFCPRWDTFAGVAVQRPEGAGSCGGGGPMSGVMHYVFGRYISTPPIDMILARGYGVVAIYPGEVVPDDADTGLAALADLSQGHADDATRWGAVAAWGWLFSRVADVLEADDRVDSDGLVAWGHSRYGKAALVAAAWDERIAGVIAHQSGTGGASLTRRKKGETLEEITRQYPHWFAPAFASYAGREEDLPVDQHELLALIAPRPVLLGNARRDVWSDPNGAFRAAKGADGVYEMMGASGLTVARLDDFDPKADLSFWIRPGTHGVVKEDWPAFLDFLDAHIKP